MGNAAMKPIPQPQSLMGWHRLQWVLNPVQYLQQAQASCPDIFDAKGIGFGERMIIVSEPQAIQKILTSDRKQFSVPGDLNRILVPLLGENSMILLSGNPHRQRRQLVMPAFHGDRMKVYGELIQKITDRVMAQLVVGQKFLARDAMQAISFGVILEAVFGFSAGDRHDQFSQKITALTEFFRSPLQSFFLFFPSLQKDWGSWSPWGRFVRDRQQVDALIYAEIAERRAHPGRDRGDILSLLLAARDEEGNALSDQELRDELMTLLFAGHETTATVMAWGLYWFNRQPETRERLQAELASLGENPDPMAIFRLPYLTAFCQETLRIYPVAMLTFPRVVEEPVELLGYTLAPGTVVMGSMYLVHQREDLYPNPDQFRPDRFLERQYSPYEFVPFGGGSRRCIGEALALFEMKLVIARVVMGYDLQLTERQPEKPRRRGVTLSPAKGVPLILKERKKSNPASASLVAGGVS